MHKIRISNTSLSVNIASFPHIVLQSTYMQLPFAMQSIDLVLLPHTLERNKDAKRVLSESWRVLAPNGHLILLGINPFSLWGSNAFLLSLKSQFWDVFIRFKHFLSVDSLSRWRNLSHRKLFISSPINQSYGDHGYLINYFS